MAKITFQGGDDFGVRLEKLGQMNARGSIEKAVARGTGIVADAIRKATEALSVTDEGYARHGSARHTISSITKRQKEGLLESLGVSPVQTDKNGFTNRKVGFDGYNKVKTKKYPNGQPNALIARAINSGTSFRAKTRFVDIAVNKNRKKAIEGMEESIDADIAEIFEE